MKFLFPTIIAVLLIALSMYTMLQFIHWELAMRIIGISISVLSAVVGMIYLPKEATIN